MHRHLIQHATCLLVLATLLGVGSAGAHAEPPASTPAADAPGALAWTACGDGAEGWECATLAVPLDYAHPDGTTIDLAVTRLPASDPARAAAARRNTTWPGSSSPASHRTAGRPSPT